MWLPPCASQFYFEPSATRVLNLANMCFCDSREKMAASSAVGAEFLHNTTELTAGLACLKNSSVEDSKWNAEQSSQVRVRVLDMPASRLTAFGE